MAGSGCCPPQPLPTRCSCSGGNPAASLSRSRGGKTAERSQSTPALATGWQVPTKRSRPGSRACRGRMEEAGSGAAEKGSTRSASGGAEGAREALAVYLGAARSAARSRSEMTMTRSAEA